MGITGYLLFRLLWWFAGTDIPGVVTGAKITHSTKRGTHYVLKYQYQVAGQTKSGSGNVERAVYDRFQPLNQVDPGITLRYFAIGPLEHEGICEGTSFGNELGLLAFLALFWDALVGMMAHQLWVKPLQRRWLYQHGAATTGKLLSKRLRAGKSRSYYLKYEFKDAVMGRPFIVETKVWKRTDWELANEGQAVTVLYAPDNPKRSTVYEFGGYKVETGG